MIESLEIRKARPEEIPACADLYLKVLVDTFTWLEPERHRREDFLNSVRDEDIYVAVENGQVVGLAGFYRPQNFLHSLYVLDRGRGVGKALLDHVSAQASGPVSLKVQSANHKAQRFYEREGFVCVEEGRDWGSDIDWRRLVRVRAET
ncbi:GNAT family N-acetyltransferase [Phenylobacterium deserti]|uniref:GNAT family N-acetyltransferase n=1 Tax=Phenylobacterium deserti TaxID=1914756 RepID=UPI001402E26F|nr:GNAT family N-acetyltransferase [Phenylobacterium deserti]